MTLQDQCVSLELSKKLYEAGVRVESYFKWVEKAIGYNLNTLEAIKWSGEWVLDTEYPTTRIAYPAYSVAELGEMLPCMYISYKERHGLRELDEYKWWSGMLQDLPAVSSATEADARAKMLLHLISSGIIQVAK